VKKFLKKHPKIASLLALLSAFGMCVVALLIGSQSNNTFWVVVALVFVGLALAVVGLLTWPI